MYVDTTILYFPMLYSAKSGSKWHLWVTFDVFCIICETTDFGGSKWSQNYLFGWQICCNIKEQYVLGQTITIKSNMVVNWTCRKNMNTQAKIYAVLHGDSNLSHYFMKIVHGLCHNKQSQLSDLSKMIYVIL